MKAILVSNYFNHHQKSLSDNLYEKCDSYAFVSTARMSRERVKLGYGGQPDPEYVIYTYLGDRIREVCQNLVDEADVLITGSAPETMVRPRIQAGKLTFRYSERPLKKGPEWKKYLPRLIKWHWLNPRRSPVYLLCASAYTAGDYARFGLFRDRAYQWGYFPPTIEYPSVDELMGKKDPQKILWCGRFLDWKHPDDALRVARALKEEGRDFVLEFVGTGQMEKELHEMTRTLDLEDRVRFLGSMPPEQVRQHMEEAGIYLFTSDRQEGWGAVLNESMNSGCAVVASHAIGAVPFLMKDGENGLVYRSGDVAMLTDKVRVLLDHPEKQRALGRAAYETMVTTWNAEVAAERLMTLAERILAGEKSPDLYEDGPCSKAPILEDDWI